MIGPYTLWSVILGILALTTIRRLGILNNPPECSSVRGYSFTKVTAPSEAEETSAAYLENTPRL